MSDLGYCGTWRSDAGVVHAVVHEGRSPDLRYRRACGGTVAHETTYDYRYTEHGVTTRWCAREVCRCALRNPENPTE